MRLSDEVSLAALGVSFSVLDVTDGAAEGSVDNSAGDGAAGAGEDAAMGEVTGSGADPIVGVAGWPVRIDSACETNDVLIGLGLGAGGLVRVGTFLGAARV